ncbi:MAG: tRNA (N6-isopentenyl adenosine(37)-C2)-methylthiotransferase MiaB [Legionellales bacterium]|nr:tRNA (N6-isopentenyl adenosine(37)-C2)-methylthiotransferase MiaB [Legionellales bacterium]
MTKVFAVTYGCQMNSYDTDQMVKLLAQSHQMSKTDVAEDASCIIFNTCSIREKAAEKVFSDLGKYKQLKQQRPELVIVVAGCVASQEGEAITQRSDLVDIVIGPQTLHRLPELYTKALTASAPIVDVSFAGQEKFDAINTKPLATRVSSYISIMEGCSQFCSFCIVPYTRGAEISRRFDEVLKEAYLLSQQGVKEITLLGQNVNRYQSVTADDHPADLALLIHYIASIDGIQSIRFTTSHPAYLDDGLIDAFAEEPKLADHFHLPVQSGSNRMLTAMKRGHDIQTFIDKVKRLRKARPGITISSDFIVGFPGETEADFQETMRLVTELKIDQSYSFIYSPRPNTPASELADDVSLACKKKRLKRLQDRLDQNMQSINQTMLGQVYNILVTGRSKRDEHELTGKTANNRVINFEGSTDLIGHFVSVRVVACNRYTLRGELTA